MRSEHFLLFTHTYYVPSDYTILTTYSNVSKKKQNCSTSAILSLAGEKQASSLKIINLSDNGQLKQQIRSARSCREHVNLSVFVFTSNRFTHHLPFRMWKSEHDLWSNKEASLIIQCQINDFHLRDKKSFRHNLYTIRSFQLANSNSCNYFLNILLYYVGIF